MRKPRSSNYLQETAETDDRDPAGGQPQPQQRPAFITVRDVKSPPVVYKRPSETAAANRLGKEQAGSNDGGDEVSRRRNNTTKNNNIDSNSANHGRTPATDREGQSPLNNLVCGTENGLCIQS